MPAFAFGYYFHDLERREPQRPVPRVRRPFRLAPAQIVGVVGSLLLLGGLWLPAYAGWGGQTLFDVGFHHDGLPIDGVAMLVFASVSLFVVLKDQCVLLWLTGIGCQMALASSYALWEMPPYSGSPLFQRIIRVDQPLTGWWLMELGVLLLLVAAALGDLLAARQVRTPILRPYLGPAENWQFCEPE